jgi:hypothetical protein
MNIDCYSTAFARAVAEEILGISLVGTGGGLGFNFESGRRRDDVHNHRQYADTLGYRDLDGAAIAAWRRIGWWRQLGAKGCGIPGLDG